MLRRCLRLCALLALTLGLFSSGTAAAAGSVNVSGTNDGAAFKIDIPANWNGTLDSEFAFKTLLAPNDTSLQLVHITDPQGNLQRAETLLTIAQSTPQGRARLALVSAIGDLPGWFSAATPEPAATDNDLRETN